jgi:ABC-type phosphate transport system substrate-binding protein
MLDITDSVKFPTSFKFFLTIFLTLFVRIAKADITIIVNQANSIDSINLPQLEKFFMKKERKWENGDLVRFFDYRDENNNRKTFLKKYIKKTSREIELYWIGEKIYTGNIAPIQITSDSMMISIVSRFPGGIGYVNSKFPLPKTVKAIKVTPSKEETKGSL